MFHIIVKIAYDGVIYAVIFYRLVVRLGYSHRFSSRRRKTRTSETNRGQGSQLKLLKAFFFGDLIAFLYFGR